jgi:hypothetical protein
LHYIQQLSFLLKGVRMLLRNDLLEFSEPRRRIVRILWVDVARSFAYVFDVASEAAEVELHRLPVLESELAKGRVRRLEADPYLVVANPEALPPKHIELRERAWGVVADLVLQEPDIYEPRRRGQLVQEATRRHGVSHPTIYRYLRRYWQRGQTPNALLPDYANSGGKGKTRTATPGVKRGRPRKDGEAAGVNVDDQLRMVFRLAAARHAASHTHFARRSAYDEMLRDFLCQRTADPYSRRVRRTQSSATPPSFGQFNYWLDQDHLVSVPPLPSPLADSAPIAREGQPGAAYRLDVLPFGLQLLHGQDRSLLGGTPVLYVMTDVFSGMVTGFFASTEAPGWPQAMMALASCATDKQRLARRHGRLLSPQAWPSSHLPERLLVPPDLMKRANGDALLANFHVRCVADFEAADRAWMPALRASFGAAADGRSGPLDAVLTLMEFRRIVMDLFIAYNHTQTAAHAPLQLWDWGVRHRSGSLKQFPEDLVRCCLLPVSEAWVTAEGICVQGNYFSCARAESERWFERARMRGRWPVRVAVDPSSEGMVYLVDAATPMQFHVCRPVERIAMVRPSMQMASYT